MRINHNISAQLANVNLKKADRRVSSSLERLTSGYKINKAADDSAGMAITNKMRAQIRALDQASRNAQDGDSIIETAEGALAEVENILQRIRELAVQAANDTYDLEDREAIQNEVDQMLEEIDRISSTTEFNGKPLLDGSTARSISTDNAGIHALSVSMAVEKGDYGVTVDTLAEPATLSVALPQPKDKAYSVRINDAPVTILPSDTEYMIQKKIVDVCDAMDIDVTTLGGDLTMTTRAPGSGQRITYKDEFGDDYLNQGKDAVITLDTAKGFSDSASYSADGNLVTIVDNNGFEIQMEAGVTGATTLRVFDAGYLTIQIGANEGQTLDMNFPKMTCNNLGLKTEDGTAMINFCTQFGATNALNTLDRAVKSVSDARSQLGAYQNRLEATRSSLDLSSQNITEAMSRIGDTDMADEMTQYTQQEVLSQAATSMLAQANNRPQQIMGLLQG